MTVLIDPPRWPAHGRLWSHLASDTSLDELHAFARRAGIPARGFEGDHYDVPAEMHPRLVAMGAVPVQGRELLAALVAAGLRLPKRRGEKVLSSGVVEGWPSGAGPHRVDVVLSTLGPPSGTSDGGWVVVTDGRGRVLLVRRGAASWDLPGGRAADGSGTVDARGPAEARGSVDPRGAADHEAAVAAAVRAATGLDLPVGATRPLGYLRVRPAEGPWTYSVVLRWQPREDRLPTTAGVIEHAWLERRSVAESLHGHLTWPLVERVLGGGG